MRLFVLRYRPQFEPIDSNFGGWGPTWRSKIRIFIDRLVILLQSSYSDIDGKALYFIDFIVGASKRKSDGSSSFEADTVQVVCTVNHLQSLVAALKAATRKLEAIADSVK